MSQARKRRSERHAYKPHGTSEGRMMESPFLDRHEIAAYLHMPEKPARALLARHGVLPVNTDTRSHKTRLLWSRMDVMRVADTLLASSRPQPAEYVPPRKGSRRVIGKDIDALYAELSQ